MAIRQQVPSDVTKDRTNKAQLKKSHNLLLTQQLKNKGMFPSMPEKLAGANYIYMRDGKILTIDPRNNKETVHADLNSALKYNKDIAKNQGQGAWNAAVQDVYNQLSKGEVDTVNLDLEKYTKDLDAKQALWIKTHVGSIEKAARARINANLKGTKNAKKRKTLNQMLSFMNTHGSTLIKGVAGLMALTIVTGTIGGITTKVLNDKKSKEEAEDKNNKKWQTPSTKPSTSL